MRDTEPSAGQREYLENIGSSSAHPLSLVNDILDLSKIESGTFHLDQAPFDLRQALTYIAKAQTPKAHAKGLDLRWRLDEQAPAGWRGTRSACNRC